MAETETNSDQALHSSSTSTKRAAADEPPLRGSPADPKKKQKLDDATPEAPVADAETPNGAAEKAKAVLTPADKGKGKMVVEVEEEEEEEESDEDSDGGDEEQGERESDYEEDPLAEVDLSNILPSRTRRREPPPPGSYLVNEREGVDEDDDEDDEDEELQEEEEEEESD